ncbi:MAG TPA: NAD(P)-dependent oxidoreductase [Candidatus Hydrogenedentes bacterium]|nr:NAD(P)-dependent oxidoreductase [Candidatus Hydrogenedentota bacterium]HOV72470.1 NAD(P)-dependent oxidoreductase [Candidatus Hydrogenedentota bacterium]HPC15366.1 NAD(P)-dependent oxidoreductase [Candidatus Hydrogenedentota bacterium]HRT19321.1 NAD(P)-dependent oxidoreductase [Candidatus Hydrogenedentota bacterium]HRT63401.1 NAD(P)-dependent oxidoreductase [Candidatus Hydrogenedentota bacterium]
MRRRIFLTGSSGRLGAACLRVWRDAHDVIPFDVRAPDVAGGTFTIGSITDSEAVERAMADADTVVHCAAIPGTRKPYHALVETNVLGTFNVLEAAGRNPRVERFVFISSLMYHGLSEPPFTNRPRRLPVDEDQPSMATDYYACSKVEAEYWCRAYVRRFGKPVVTIRPPYIVSVESLDSMAAQPPPDYPHLCDYIGVMDLVEAIARAIEYDPPEGYEAFLVHAEDQRSTIPSMDLAGRHFAGVPVDRAWLEACGGYGSLVCYARARDKLGWNPKFRCAR